MVCQNKDGYKKMKNRLMEMFKDILCDELAKDDRIKVEPIKLDVRSEGVEPFHLAVSVGINANFDQEARRMVRSM